MLSNWLFFLFFECRKRRREFSRLFPKSQFWVKLLICIAWLRFLKLILFQLQLTSDKFTYIGNLITRGVELLTKVINVDYNFLLLKVLKHLLELFGLHLLGLLLSVQFIIPFTDFSKFFTFYLFLTFTFFFLSFFFFELFDHSHTCHFFNKIWQRSDFFV